MADIITEMKRRKIKSSGRKEFCLQNGFLLPMVLFITFVIEGKVTEYFIHFLFSRCFDSLSVPLWETHFLKKTFLK
jgi:hypothetical protein